jgi:hypothetical protein
VRSITHVTRAPVLQLTGLVNVLRRRAISWGGKDILSDTTAPLDRDAGGVLWRRTLSQIPSLFGRFVWVASLRNPNTGTYEHHGLAVLFGKEGANRALRLSHLACCREWLNSSLEEQMNDMRLHLSTQPEGSFEIIGNWQELGFWRTILPASIRGAERAHYLQYMETLLTLLRTETNGGASRRNA